MADDLLQIRPGARRAHGPAAETVGTGVSRRRFLQILGTSAAASSAAGCAGDKEQRIVPRVKSDDAQIPGVAAWFATTCTECTAGCGLSARNVDGRTVKVEGNRDHPVNRGGVCALGQASLQSLYDPDRVREPLVRQPGAKAAFKPTTWDDALAKFAERIGQKGTKNAFLSGELTGSSSALVDEWCAHTSSDRHTFDLLQPVGLAEATRLVTGVYGVPTYLFDRAEVVVSFGADFLETWVSPVEYARDWSRNRRGEKPAKFFHVEPRLSLTGANADSWSMAAPGTEESVALSVLREVLARGRGGDLPAGVLARLREISSGATPESASAKSGVPASHIVAMGHALAEAGRSIVLPGGATAATTQARGLDVAVQFINLALGNFGQTLLLDAVRTPRSSLSGVRALLKALDEEKVNVLVLHECNPAFTLPPSHNFALTARKARFVVAVTSHLDETAMTADLILPPHTGLERWGDVEQVPGVLGVLQPTMAPVFATKDPGDVYLEVAAMASLPAPKAPGEDNVFREYVKGRWKGLFEARGMPGEFERFWTESLSRGGVFRYREPAASSPVPRTDPAAFEATGLAPAMDARGVTESPLTLLPFYSVKAFDGRAANRPWLQELPDPMSQTVWDAWAELHPSTASGLGVAQGDVVQLRNYYGEVTAPVYVTDHVHPGVVAVPVGQGHEHYGRYARSVGAGSVLGLLPPSEGPGETVALVSAEVSVTKSRFGSGLVSPSGSPSQEDRGLARTRVLTPTGHLPVGGGHGPTHGSEGGHRKEGTESAAHEGHGGEGHGGHDGAPEPHGRAVVRSDDEEAGREAAAGGHEGTSGGAATGGHGAADAHSGHEPKQMYVQREHPLYRWGMAVDLAACTGCSACVVACYAENNVPVVGRDRMAQGREMSWLRIERYFDEGPAEELRVSFLPMMCQHCNNAPCEPVCPVYATYHNEEGLNSMVYNRCVGTRYCSNNCSYKVRRFNWVDFDFPSPLDWQLNPDVTKRTMGVMEKCTFCVQRIVDAKDAAKDEGRLVRDGEVRPACVQSCPSEALVFGNLNDPESAVSRLHRHDRAYKVLDHHLNTQPAVAYLEDVKHSV